MGEKQERTIPNAIIDNEIEMLMRKVDRFDKIKVGDNVKIPPYGKKAKVIEKYPHMFVAKAKNGYKVCFNRGDFIVAMGMSGTARK